MNESHFAWIGYAKDVFFSKYLRQEEKINKLLVWCNEGLENRIVWADFVVVFLLLLFFCFLGFLLLLLLCVCVGVVCSVLHLYCSKCFCSCTIKFESNKRKKQQFNKLYTTFLVLLFSVLLLCRYVNMQSCILHANIYITKISCIYLVKLN